MQKRIIYCVLIYVFFAIPAFSADDDIEFAQSLGEAGYNWLAEEELKKLEQSSDPIEKLRTLRVLSNFYNAQGDLVKRDRYLDEFIEKAKGVNNPQIQVELQQIMSQMWENKEETILSVINDLENLYSQDPPKTDVINKKRKDLEKVSGDLLKFREDTYKKLEAQEGEKAGDEDFQIKLDMAKYNLARALYLHSFAYKKSNEVKQKELLNKAINDYLSTLDFMYGSNVIVIPFYRANCLWELQQWGKAGEAYLKCIDFNPDPRNETVRQQSYLRAVEAYYKTKQYKDVAQTAFGFQIEFPTEKTSYKGQSVRYFLALALYNMTASDFKEVKEFLNLRNEREDEANKIMNDIIAENGPRSWDASEALAKYGQGWQKHIQAGRISYINNDLDKAISSLQLGLKSAPKDMDPKERLKVLAQAWYFLGFSYYKKNMLLPAIICFKEGTTRFMEDYKKYSERISEEDKQWFNSNSKNWQTISGIYYKDNKTELSLNVFKEALLGVGQIEGQDENLSAMNINLVLAIILMRNDDYSGAIVELDKIDESSADYLTSLRLRAQAMWGQYKQEGEKSKELSDKAFSLYGEFLKKAKARLKASDDEEEKADLKKNMAKVNGMLVTMQFKIKEYQRIVDDIEAFWAAPPANKQIAASSILYQVYSIIKLPFKKDDPADTAAKKKYMLQGKDLIERLKRDYPDEKDKLLKCLKALGFGFYNLSSRFGELKNEKEQQEALENSGILLHDFIMSAGDEVDEATLINVATIIYERLKDYKRSEEVTYRILQIFKERIAGQFDPYDPATKEELEKIKEEMFDRSESRTKWDQLIDRMYDNKETATRERFKNTKKEFWKTEIKELPYNYESAYVDLSEAILLELGMSPEDIKEREKLRDSKDADVAEKFWTDLFKEFQNATDKDPAPFIKLNQFFENSIVVNNYKARLVECYKHNGKLDEAFPIAEDLDNYFINEPNTKWTLAGLYLERAKVSEGEERTKASDEAKNIYLWIKVHTPNDPQGRKDHYEAVKKIAEIWDIKQMPESAARTLQDALKYDPVPFPAGYEDEFKTLAAEYLKKAEGGKKSE